MFVVVIVSRRTTLFRHLLTVFRWAFRFIAQASALHSSNRINPGSGDDIEGIATTILFVERLVVILMIRDFFVFCLLDKIQSLRLNRRCHRPRCSRLRP
jgi:hypothetical protein